LQWRSIETTFDLLGPLGSGIHGAICVLEPSFNGDTLATGKKIYLLLHALRFLVLSRHSEDLINKSFK